MDFDARDWFWIVAGDETRVYSSALGDYMLIADQRYRDWVKAGGAPTRIANEFELGEVLADYSLRPEPAGIVDGYAERRAREVVDPAGFRVTMNHENRLRTIERALGLNGSPENLPALNARDAIKKLM